MRAAFIERTGPPDVIRVGDRPDPRPGPDDVLVRVRAAAVNPIDTYVRGGAVAMPLPLPFVVGCDLAGDVVAVGEAVAGFAVGDRVWGSNQGLLGRQGTCAEFAAVNARWLYPTPADVSDRDAAAAALVGITAHLGLVTHAGLQAGVGDETEVRGDPHEGRGRRVAIRHVRRGRVEPAGVDGCELGARALPTEQALVRSPHAIADGEPRDGLAHRHDIACQIASHHERQGQRHRHGTAADVGVDRVHRRRTHPHEHVVGTWSRVGPITHADDVRRAGSFDECRTHPSPFS